MSNFKEFCKNGHLMDISRSVTPNGRSHCGICRRAWSKKYRNENREAAVKASRKFRLKRGHNLSLEKYDRILMAQNEKCAICKRKASEFEKALCLDHCHETSIVRGLLCQDCNLGLGNFKDNITSLEFAIEYLKLER